MAETLLQHLQNSFNCGCGPCSLSDRNCQCYLKLGSDFYFIQEVAKQVYFGKYYLRHIFGKTPNGRRVVSQNEKRTKAEYPGVYDGTQKTIVTLPPFAAYDSRVKDAATWVEEDLLRRVKENDTKDKNELEAIKKHLQRTQLRAQAGEGSIFNAAISAFFHHRGLFVNGYEPNSHLKIFVEQAEQQRKQKKSSGGAFSFSQLELSNLEARGIDVSIIHDGVKLWMNEIRNKTTASFVPGKLVREALEEAIRKKIGPDWSKTALNKAKKKFQEIKNYPIADVCSSLTLCSYDEAVRPPGEYDFWITLADFAMSINIEVKKQLNPDTQNKRNLNDSLKSAAKQTADHARYQSQMFGRMVSGQGQFVKICAILPGELDYSKICGHCSSLIITGQTREEIQEQLHKLCARLTKGRNPVLDKKRSHQDFLTMFEATLGFSHISVKQNLTSFAWNQIEGKNKDILDISAGWTKADTDLLLEDIVFQNVINRPHDIYKSIYWNKEQLVVLLNHCPYVIFAADYSAGK